MITLKRENFDGLDDISLIWACIEPTIRIIRGKNYEVKYEVYNSLTIGLQALLMFQILYGHSSNGVEEFYALLSYLPSSDGVWSQLKRGFQYFGDADMVELLEKMHANAPAGISSELSAKLNLLNESLAAIMPSTIRLVAAYIRHNKDEYVQIVD